MTPLMIAILEEKEKRKNRKKMKRLFARRVGPVVVFLGSLAAFFFACDACFGLKMEYTSAVIHCLVSVFATATGFGVCLIDRSCHLFYDGSNLRRGRR